MAEGSYRQEEEEIWKAPFTFKSKIETFGIFTKDGKKIDLTCGICKECHMKVMLHLGCNLHSNKWV